MPDVRKAIDDTINNRMGGVCEGALWVEENRYGPYVENFKDPYDVVKAFENPDRLLETTKVSIYLVPKGEGYKNFRNQFMNCEDWLDLVDTYEWQLAYKVDLRAQRKAQRNHKGEN